jgi:hypothetical protein
MYMTYRLPPGSFPPFVNVPTDSEFTTFRGMFPAAAEAWDHARRFGGPTWHYGGEGGNHIYQLDVNGVTPEGLVLMSSQDQGPDWVVFERWEKRDALKQEKAHGGWGGKLPGVSCQ